MSDEDASVISVDASGKHDMTDNLTLKPQITQFYPLSSEKGSKYSLHAVQEEVVPQNEDSSTGAKHFLGPASKKKTKRNRGFGVRRVGEQKSERAAFDYEDKYPEDPIYEETAPTARVWRTYIDESQKFDADRVGDWRDTVDVLLVFAGLFSAVVSAFVVQFSQNLQPDYSQISAYLLFELVSIQQAISNGTSVNLPLSFLDPTAKFTPATSIAWVNGLWFASLALSLSAALVSVLVKQWLHHYMILPSGTPQERSHVRQYRYMGLRKWQVPLIIGLLPMLMHLALAFFFIGLVVFLGPMHIIIAWVTGGIGAIAYLVVIVTNVLPFWLSQCPYRTPLADAIYISASYFSQHVVPKLKGFFAESLPGMPSSPNRIHVQSLNKIETDTVKSISNMLNVDALYWLYDMSSNPTVRSIVIQAIAGLPMEVSEVARQRFAGTNILEEQTVLLNECLSPGPFADIIIPVPGKEAKIERLLRFELQIPVEISHLTRIPYLKLPEFSSPRLCAVVITSHFQTSVFVPLAVRHAEPIQFILDLFDRKGVDVQLPPLVWSRLVKRACDINIGGMEHNMESWISLSTALLEVSAKDWSSPPSHAISLHTPHISTLRQAIIMYLYRDVVDNLLDTYTWAGCNAFARQHAKVIPRIQLLLAIIEFLLKIVFRGAPDSAPGLRLFVSVMTDLERCVARYPSLTTDESRGIILGIDRVVQSNSNLFNAATPRDSQLWSGRICILEIYRMMLGMPSRLRTGFLNFPLDIRHSLSLITMRKLIQVAFEDESWLSQELSMDYNGNLNPTHQLYFHTLSQILHHCFRNHVAVAYDAFEQIDCIRLSASCQLHPEFVRVLETYTLGLTSSSLDYVYRPDILLIVCTTLACNNVSKVKGPSKALAELAKKRPDDPGWDMCRKRLLELAQDNSDSTDWFKKQKVDDSSLSEVRRKICDAIDIVERITGPDMENSLPRIPELARQSLVNGKALEGNSSPQGVEYKWISKT